MRQRARKAGEPKSGRWRRAQRLLLGVAVAFLGGCAGGPDSERGQFMRVYTPQVPVFLSGPAAVFLTNTSGFSARATVRGDSAFPGSELVEGELLGCGSKLVFAPRERGSKDRQMRLGGFSYIWDVASGSGFVLSDALQAYAPVASTLRVTALAFTPGGAAPREATVVMNDGSKAVFHVWPEQAGSEFPTRLEARGSPPLGLSLSKVRRQAPAAELFAPPDGFAKYPNAAVMADEIAARHHNLRRSTREPALSTPPAEPR